MKPRMVVCTLVAPLVISTALVVITKSASADPFTRFLFVGFNNHSDSALTLDSGMTTLEGCWTKAPPQTIPSGADATFDAVSCNGDPNVKFDVVYNIALGGTVTFPLANATTIGAGAPTIDGTTVPPGGRTTSPNGFTLFDHGAKVEGVPGVSAGLVWGVTLSRCDCDGIPPQWKGSGVTIDPGGGNPPQFIDLPAMGVALDRPNILVQFDWMQGKNAAGSNINQQLDQGSIDDVIAAFDRDPVTYLGATRPGVTLIVDAGPNSTITPGGAKWGSLSQAKPIPWSPTFTSCADTKGNFSETPFDTLLNNNFKPTGRYQIFHYAVAVAGLVPVDDTNCPSTCPAVDPGTNCWAGTSGNSFGFEDTNNNPLPANDRVGLVVSLGAVIKSKVTGLVGCWWTNCVGSRSEQAGTFMHELGHVLGLHHGGGTDDTNFKPNHPSVMDYLYQMSGVPIAGKPVNALDYSRDATNSVDETHLTEATGMPAFDQGSVGYGFRWVCPNGKWHDPEFNLSPNPADWNCDQGTVTGSVTPDGGTGFDVNGDGIQGTLQGVPADWNVIDFKSGGVQGSGATAGDTTSPPIPTGLVGDPDELTADVAARNRVPPLMTLLGYTGPSGGHYHDPVTMSATLVDLGNNEAATAGKTISFALGASSQDTCSGTTDANGNATCTITPTQPAGSYSVEASFAGDGSYLPQSDINHTFTITPEETTMAYTGPTAILAGASGATLTATMVEDGSGDNDGDGGSAGPVPSETVTLGIGTQTCTGTTDSSGNVRCTIPSVSVPLGPQSVSASFAGDSNYASSSDSKTAIVFGFPTNGAFSAGDRTVASASSATTITWWGDTWWQLNRLSGGAAPPADKGFTAAVALPTTTPATCGGNWTTTGGNSPPPVSGVPSYMGIVVTSKVTQSGSKISGNIVEIVVVKTDPGYQPDPLDHGTGTIVATYCRS